MRSRLTLAAIALLTAATLGIACGSNEGDRTPTPTATSTPVAENPTESPTPTPEATGPHRTGDPALDQIIDAVETRDVAALATLAEYQRLGCTTADGLGGPPKCDEDQLEGDITRVFWTSSCELAWSPTATQALGAFAHQATGLWAALVVENYPVDDLMPAPDHLLVFHSLHPDSVTGADIAAYLLVTDGRITGTSLVCIGGLADLLNTTAFDLTVAAGPWDEPVDTAEEPPTTGIPALDELLAAGHRYDFNTLLEGAWRAMADLPGIACTVNTDGPGGLECNAAKGEQPGDLIPVFPQAYCEGALSRDPLPAITNFLNGAPELVSVVSPPDEPSESALYPHGAYWVVYRLTGLDVPNDVGARLHVTGDGAITVIWYGCDPNPADLATWRGEQLTEIPTR